jgi:glycosyltransferase 2 family protein
VHTLRNRLLIGLGLGILVMLGLALWSDLTALGRIFGTFRWAFFPLALLCTLFNYVLRFVKWHYYVRRVGARDLSAKSSARLFVAGFPLAVTPGKAGEALKAWWLAEWSSVPFARGLPVVLAERFSDGVAVLALSAVGILAMPSLWPVFLALLAACAAVVALSQARPLAFWLLARAERVPIVGKQVHALREFYEAGAMLLAPKPLLIAVSLGILSWLGEGVGFYLILLGLGIAPAWGTLANAVFVLGFSTLVGSVSTLPGGLGAAEASITGLLLLTVTADHGLAGAATLLIRLATLWFGVALGLIVWAATPSLWNRRAIEEAPVPKSESPAPHSAREGT